MAHKSLIRATMCIPRNLLGIKSKQCIRALLLTCTYLITNSLIPQSFSVNLFSASQMKKITFVSSYISYCCFQHLSLTRWVQKTWHFSQSEKKKILMLSHFHPCHTCIRCHNASKQRSLCRNSATPLLSSAPPWIPWRYLPLKPIKISLKIHSCSLCSFCNWSLSSF